ncbi:MAG: TetR family transcriptional regulator [Dehalococcoidia bacterium]|jgi:AcrR family transcriptional regulator
MTMSSTGEPVHLPSARSDAVAHREIILEAARQLFAEKGLGAEMREIAEHAGVGVGSIYRHFDSREGLIGAVKEAAGEDLVQRLHVAAGEKDPKLALREMIHASAGLFERFGVLTEVMLRGRINELPNQKKGAFPDLTDPIAAVLQRGIEDGSFRSDLDVAVAIAAFASIFQSGMLLALASRRTYSGAADAVADFFLAAIAAPGQS